MIPVTDKARVFLLGLVLLAVGLALSPWPFLAVVIPGGIFLVLALFMPSSAGEGSE